MSIDFETMEYRIVELKRELLRLEQELAAAGGTSNHGRRFQDFKGILKGKLDSTDEQIEDCLIRMKHEGVEDDA